MSEGSLSAFSARTILEVICAREEEVLLSVTTGAARYDIVAGHGMIRHASRGALEGETALFLLLREREGTFTLHRFPEGNGTNCSFAGMQDVDARFAAWQQRLDPSLERFLDPGVLYWWRSRLSKDTAQLPPAEYDVVQLIRDRALTVDVLTTTLRHELLEQCALLQSMTQYDPFAMVPFVRPQRKGTYRCVVASRDSVLSNAFWQKVCGGDVPLAWNDRTSLYLRSLVHPGYTLDVLFLTQVLDEPMRRVAERADVLIFLPGRVVSDEETYLQELRTLAPEAVTFIWAPRPVRWSQRIPQSVWVNTPFTREAVLQALDAFL